MSVALTPELRELPRAGDADAVLAMVVATGFFSDEEQAIARELVVERLEQGAASGYEFLFAEQEGRLAGYACWGRTPQTVEGWDLYWIVVGPEWQGAGLGSVLLREVERRIAAAGGGQLWVETAGRPLYDPTRRFYERNGYELAARLRDFYAPGDDKVLYVRRLSRQ